MRVAVISDLHGNRYALEKVVASIKKEGVDQTICLGDVATLGAEPLETVRMVESLGCRCISGNHDRFVLDPTAARYYTGPGPVYDAIEWGHSELDANSIKFISGFESSFSIPSPVGDIFIFHGTPHSDEENLLAESPTDVYDSIVSVHDAAVYVCGHSHVRMMRQHNGRLFVNPGSVGAPFRRAFNGDPPSILPQAEYAVFDINGGGTTVAFKQIPLEMSVIKKELSASKNPMAQMILGNYSR
jgi:putative phosphoesterase